MLNARFLVTCCFACSICIFCGTNSYSKVKTKFNPIHTGAGRNSPPPKVFLRNSKTPQDTEKKLSDFNFTPLTVILHLLSITIVIRCCHVCLIIFGMKKQRNLNYFSRQLLDQTQICHRELFLGPEFKFTKHFYV